MSSTGVASRRRGTDRGTGSSGPNRLPANRERRPLLAVLAVLLIVGGAVAAGLVALRMSDRTEYAYLGVDLGRGQVVQEGDLRRISLTKDEVTAPRGYSEPELMTVTEASDLLGWVSTGDYPAGTLVNADMFTPTEQFPPGTAQVGLVLTPEQVTSTSLAINDNVQIYSTATSSSDEGGGAPLVGEGVVVDVAVAGGGSQSGSISGINQGLHVTVLVPQSDVANVAQAGGNGTAFVAVLPPEQSADTDAADPTAGDS